MSIIALSATARQILGDFAVRATVLLILTHASSLLLKRRSAALRHLVWAFVLWGLIALPFLDVCTTRAPGLNSLLHFGEHAPVPHPQFENSPAPIPVAPIIARLNLWDAFFGTQAIHSKSASLCVIDLVPALYLAGVLLLLIRRSHSWWRAAQIVGSSATDSDCPEIRKSFLACARELGLAEIVKLRFLRAVMAVPATVGWLHPFVLLPEEARFWSDERLHAVFLHELAHIRRRDWIVQQVASIGCSLLWFHPLAWLGFRALRIEAERAADDAVLHSGMRPSTYTGELMALIQFLQTPKPLNLTLINPMKSSILMAQSSTVALRIQAILDRAQNRNTPGAKHFALVASLLLGAMIPLSVLHLQAADPSSPGASPAAPPSGAARPAITVDRSTPEATVTTFAAAINASDFSQAAACIRGVDPAKATARSTVELMSKAKPHVQLGELLSKTNGNTALVIIANGSVSDSSSSQGNASQEHVLKDEHVNLILDRNEWKIVAANPAELSDGKNPGIFSVMGTLFAANDDVISRVQRTATAQVIQNQMRQLAMAALLFAQDHHDQWQFRAVEMDKALQPYIGDKKSITPPEGNAVDYVFNPGLENAAVTSVTSPSETVLIYEAAAGKKAQPGVIPAPAYVHNDRTSVAFVDGHVAFLTPDEFAKLRW